MARGESIHLPTVSRSAARDQNCPEGATDAGRSPGIGVDTEWDSYLVEPDTFICEGDQVAALGWVSGKYKATGIAFQARFVHWWTMTDGRATRFEAIEDTVKIAEAV